MNVNNRYSGKVKNFEKMNSAQQRRHGNNDQEGGVVNELAP
jgi:hypothetical protein